MTAIEKLKLKVNELNSEFFSISALYNLHVIEVKNTFNNAILSSYEDILKDEFNVATLINSNQILFYNVHDRNSKIVNFSIKMFSTVWKNFIKEIEKFSIKNSSNEFHKSLSNTSFIKTKIAKTSSSNIYFKIDSSTTIHSRNLLFSYKPKSLLERNFLINKENIWIKLNAKTNTKIGKNKELFASLKKPIVFVINPFSKHFASKITETLLEKIKQKSNEKLNIKIVFVDEKKKKIIIKSEYFIPLSFIEYINNYVYTNTLYEVRFAKHKKNKEI